MLSTFSYRKVLVKFKRGSVGWLIITWRHSHFTGAIRLPHTCVGGSALPQPFGRGRESALGERVCVSVASLSTVWGGRSAKGRVVEAGMQTEFRSPPHRHDERGWGHERFDRRGCELKAGRAKESCGHVCNGVCDGVK